jgi:hypothetical protein
MRAALALLICLSLLAISGCGQQGPKGDPGPRRGWPTRASRSGRTARRGGTAGSSRVAG